MSVEYSLGPLHRIKKRKDFIRIQKSGTKYRSKHFLVAVSPRIPSTDKVIESRIGITITTKVDKRAVKRNLVKRRVRELFRTHRAKITRPVDIVVIAFNGATELTFYDTYKELSQVLVKGGVISGCKDVECIPQQKK
jgi:ribonuclease P protein component